MWVARLRRVMARAGIASPRYDLACQVVVEDEGEYNYTQACETEGKNVCGESPTTWGTYSPSIIRMEHRGVRRQTL